MYNDDDDDDNDDIPLGILSVLLWFLIYSFFPVLSAYQLKDALR